VAILRSGILGNVRGKVAGVVGSQWKDKNYVREYVKPANPNTQAQQDQRTKMTDVVAFCKFLVGPVFNAYTDRFQKSMSGFNYFIKQMIDVFDGAPDYSIILLTEGKLHAPTGVIANYTPGNGECNLQWTASLGNNGKTDDAIFAAIYNRTTGLWSFASAELDRSIETMIVQLATGLTAANLETYLWAIQRSGAIVTMISSSVYDQAVEP
jgi:hypothetical protein